jgi:hypothetical protein
MTRGRRRGNPFTLFSFQDIITSVMGIILLAALLLAVELVTRTATNASTSVVQEAAEEIDSRLQAIRTDVAELQTELTSLREQALAQAATVTADAEFVASVAQTQLERLEAELAQMTAHVDERKRELAKLDARGFERRRDRQKLEALEAEIRQNDEQLEELRKSNRLFFNPVPGFSKRPWLVDLSAESITVGPMAGEEGSSPTVEHIFLSDADFLDFADRLSSESEYFIVLVRPSGVERFHVILDELRSRDFDLGFDVVAEDQTLFEQGL